MAANDKKEAEAAAPEADGGEGAAKGGFLSKKLIIMAAAGLLVVGGGGAGGYFFFFKKSAPHEEKVAAAPVKPPPTFVDLPELMVNLQSQQPGRASYLKAKVVLEVEDAKLAEQVKPLMPRVMDAFQTFLREMRPNDLEGSAGLYRMREELTKRVNLAVAPSKVNAVLFKEIVVQ
jgi:flagellar FliL protein